MANKLAGQRAKFSRAKAIYHTAGDEEQRRRAARLMAEVLAEAPANGFTEAEVTQDEEVPGEARSLATSILAAPAHEEENAEERVQELATAVDLSDLVETGQGEESVYAYAYRCAPDRMKIGSCRGDVVARVAAQIGTGTPDRPVLLLRIRTHDCRALERALHGILWLKGRQVAGAGAEWFVTTREEVLATVDRVLG